ncbi:L-serine ammonia-lyase [Pacificibacter marinus]|uniref:L-serine dehydratase n=1 Tax=Pacificibacter marinus TaxID=658057 RepID=A0A1Y5T7I7_9RHOB|nr:L-serine ammonia-lyase [Pacificibacter marinus]SEL08234.1 L-serine ammonia-lyase [Pacificibacter marinus]SLN57674.1 L-serine dehydratase TdcG [Pacificibacter marinus]
MFLSVFDIFKVGIGPSSSHTIGPMIAGNRFIQKLIQANCKPHRLRVVLHGSLAFTGKGHATDRAVMLGLAGFRPDDYDKALADQCLSDILATKTITPQTLPQVQFDPETDLIFDYGPPLSGHVNGLQLSGLDINGNVLLHEVYYSIGGGFVLSADELDSPPDDAGAKVSYPFESANEMLRMSRASNMSIGQMKHANELARYSPKELEDGVQRLWQVMSDCIDRGMATGGILPGGLNVRRRALGLYDGLQKNKNNSGEPPHRIVDWINLYAMAVNEENAAGGQVVTAPTNGAAGVVPAVMRYWLEHVPGATEAGLQDFLLTAAAIGGLVKHNASISGAECGCQAEVGSASAMAAAGLAAVLGGTPEQVENAAEIALEHHLGLTCDPVGGLVQIPCIERNGMGALKAIAAASLALSGDGTHFVSLDACILTMRETGRDMSDKYKETSIGGLALNVPAC